MARGLGWQSTGGDDRDQGFHPGAPCSSCRGAHAMAPPIDAESSAFCDDCLDSVAPIEFPEFYWDLGVGD